MLCIDVEKTKRVEEFQCLLTAVFSLWRGKSSENFDIIEEGKVLSLAVFIVLLPDNDAIFNDVLSSTVSLLRKNWIYLKP